MTTMKVYSVGTERSVELGGLRFDVKHRILGDNGGPTIEVMADVDGKPVQVLRFDCFRQAPHYHYAGAREQHDMPEGDGLEWAMEQVRSNIPTMLRAAGFNALAQQVDAAALAKGWTKVKRAVLATAPKADEAPRPVTTH